MPLPQQVPIDVAATIICVPPVTEPAYKLATLDALEVRTPALAAFTDISGVSSLDTADTTTDATAARGATSISVASATGIVAGRMYMLADAAGDADPLMVQVRLVAGTTIHLEAPLQRGVASGAVLYGWAVLAVLTDAQVGDYPGPVDIKATVTTASGAVVKFWTVARVVYRQIGQPITTATVLDLVPMASHLSRSSDLDMGDSLAAAWSAALDRLEAKGVDPWGIKDPARLTRVHATALLRFFVDADPKADPEFREEIQRQHTEALSEVAGNHNLWFDRGPAEGDRDEVAPNLAMGSMRLTRRG